MRCADLALVNSTIISIQRSVSRATILVALIAGTMQCLALADPVQWVNTYIGTTLEHGGTMPLVTTPFGMTNWTPQTRAMQRPGTSYNFSDDTIIGFIGTHQPANWMGDYGYVTLMPETGPVRTSPEKRMLHFSHADEITRPDYYSVIMRADDGLSVKTEMTATDHCALMRIAFPAGKAASILVEATRKGVRGMATVDPDHYEISGHNPDRMDSRFGPFSLPNFKGYFAVQFRQSFSNFGTFNVDGVKNERTQVVGENAGAYATFPGKDGQLVELRVGTSFISIEQARENLKKEIPNWDFELIRLRLRAQWNRSLGSFEIDGATADEGKIFYTALYHALLYPKLFSEHGRYYSAFDDHVHNGVSYTAFSIWDTFRAENSLLTLIAPRRIGPMVNALLQDYKEGGWMPKWPNPSYTNIMIATHADSLVAEAIAKGVHGFNYDLAYQAVYKDAMVPPDEDTQRRWLDEEPHTPYEARGGLTYEKQLGYIPANKTSESASSTIEDSYDDWCAAQIARRMGKRKDYRYFLQRSLNYKNLFNPSTGLMQAKNSNGSWAPVSEGWTEGDSWDYTWAALHDVGGTIELMGGAKAFNQKLDEYFNGGHDKHDNEPSHHYPFLYDFSGEPWKSQSHVRDLAATQYKNAPDGLAGDDDCGQMSAWYIFAALGFYPVNPASSIYMTGSPLFHRISLHLATGKVFNVIAVHNSAANIYIQSAKLNGRPITVPFIRYEDIVRGGTLEFVMGPAPSSWATDWRPEAIRSN